MLALHAHLDFLMSHLFTVVFFAFLIEAGGVPFPSRIILIVAATVVADVSELMRLVAVTAAGAVIGDHVPYVGGMLAGPRLLRLYCRLSLGSERCVERTVEYFKRFGAAAVLFSRFSTSLRLFAAALSGCGHLTYVRFITFDVIGTLIYAALWASLGFAIGDQVPELLDRYGRWLLVVPAIAFAAVVTSRLWRRSRYGPARADRLTSEAACSVPEHAER